MIKIKIALRVIALALLLTSLMIGLARSQAAPSSSTLSAEAANIRAFGPSVVTLRNLPSPSAPGPERLPPVPQNYSTPAQNPQASFQVRSEDKSVSANSIFGQADSNVQVASKLGPSFSNFTTYGTIDVNRSTNGTNIFANEGNSTLTVYSLSGSIIKQTFADTFLVQRGSTASRLFHRRVCR